MEVRSELAVPVNTLLVQLLCDLQVNRACFPLLKRSGAHGINELLRSWAQLLRHRHGKS